MSDTQVDNDLEIDGLTQCRSKYGLVCDITHDVRIIRERYKECFLCIDIDNFQQYLDYNGFGISDKALITVSEQLNNLYPQSKIYRHGGDEFVVSGVDKFNPDLGNGLDLNIKHSIVEVDTLVDEGRPHRTTSWIMLHIHSGIVNSTISGAYIKCLERKIE